ncbi:MAG: DUF58 domain-containing protein [Halanaeroarchaeum sp.]
MSESRTVRLDAAGDRHDTARWAGISALALLPVAVGAVFDSAGALLVGAVGIAFAAYGSWSRRSPATVTLERSVTPTDPDPGDDVTVTLTLTNGGRFLPDLRVVDGVPRALSVDGGSPRIATSLRSGKRATVTYHLEARRGRHVFGPTRIEVVSASGSTRHAVRPELEDHVTVVPDLPTLEAIPLRGQSAGRVGRLEAGTGGTGVEFHAVREYRPGDPLSRIDWKRLARTGGLSTVQFHEERAAAVVLLVDARSEAYRTGPTGASIDHAVHAAGAVADGLLGVGDRVGLAALGPRWTWLEPGLGRDHRAHLRQRLALEEAFDPIPPDAQFVPRMADRRLRKHLPADAQVVFCSPVLDDDAVEHVRRLEAGGHPVTVVSPNVTGAGTDGHRLVATERRLRLRRLRRHGIRVVDWDPGGPLQVAVERAARGWSR